MVAIYGIPNCDTMRKARKWLDGHGVEYEFHDYKKRGVDEDRLRAWVAELGWETLLNRRGMMWRKLPEDVRAIVHGVLRHRLNLSYEANADGMSANDVVDALLKNVAVA